MSERYEIRQGDVLERLREMGSNRFDGCLCDPPYGLSSTEKRSPQRKSGVEPNKTGFMGMAWDAAVPGTDVWCEVLRVLKPGAFLLAFGGTRTHHRLMCAIEDAGFELRDVCMWIFGSGFPKSLDISKAIDKAARGVPQGGADPTSANHGKYKGGCSEDNPDGRGFGAGPGKFMAEAGTKEDREMVPEAQAWDGYGTALKPGYEPIIVAMKPLDGTFAGNALKHGVAGLNIDGSRIDLNGDYKCAPNGRPSQTGLGDNYDPAKANRSDTVGRWPANVIHDGSDEVLAAFPDAPGQLADASTNADQRKTQNTYGAMKRGSQEASADRRYTDNGSTNFAALPGARRLDSGSAARFFYCAKASSEDRGHGNTHPTVKPQDLCRYLAKLILPPERNTPRRLIVPYSGSGSEMLGAVATGWDEVVGIEGEEAYIAIAQSRLDRHCPLLA